MSLCSQGSGARAGAQPFLGHIRKCPPQSHQPFGGAGVGARVGAAGQGLRLYKAETGAGLWGPDDLISYQSPPSQVNACPFSDNLIEK